MMSIGSRGSQRVGHAAAQTGGEVLELVVRHDRDAERRGGAMNVRGAGPLEVARDGERFHARMLGAEPVGVHDQPTPRRHHALAPVRLAEPRARAGGVRA
jgi:hypothetical protein